MLVENKKKLSELGLISSQSADLEVLGLSLDSRTIKEGYLFAALPGVSFLNRYSWRSIISEIFKRELSGVNCHSRP
jgi:UDP-N-acetylmuramyl tripeptide synthase